MSNLHLLLDEANKHDPKGFIPAVNNTFPWKDELGLSTYREQMELPKAINFVDGTVAAPTTVDGDVYVLTGSGVIDSSWGNATFGDWVRFTNTIATEITPLAGYLCYDVTAASWMEFDGAVWAVFGGGVVVSTIFTGGTMAADSTIAMANKKVTFSGGNLDQTNSAVINTITGTSAGNFSDSAYYNDTGVRSQFLMGGSTYGVGGNLELINDTFGIRTTDDFPIGSRNGVIKFSLGGDFTNANTRVKFTPTGAIFGAAVGLISAGAELDVRGAAKIATDLTLTTGDITQTNNVVVNIITATSAGSLSEFAYYNDTGIRGQLLMGGSTYGVGGNLELINNTFGIRTTDDFPIGSRNGDIKFSLGADFTNANTRAKFTSTGAIFGAAVGLVSAGAELHVKSSGSIDSTTAVLVQNLLGADLLEVKDGGSIIANGQITQARGSGSIGRKLELSGNPLYYTEDYYSSGMKYDMYHAGSLAVRLNANGESVVGALKSGAIRIISQNVPMTFDLQDNGNYTVVTDYVSGYRTTWRYNGSDTARIDSNGDSFISGNTGFGTTTPLAKAHIVGDLRIDETTTTGKTISTDFLPVNVNGTVRYLALYD